MKGGCSGSQLVCRKNLTDEDFKRKYWEKNEEVTFKTFNFFLCAFFQKRLIITAILGCLNSKNKVRHQEESYKA